MASGTSKPTYRKENRKSQSIKEKDRPEEIIYKTIVENAAVALWTTPYDSFDFTYISPEAEKIFGYPQNECLQEGFFIKILFPEEREWVQEYSRMAVQEQHSYQLEYHIITKKGKVKALRDTIRLTYRNGKPYQRVGVTMDISAYNQTLGELQASNRKFYSVFHNFPIPAIISRVKDAHILDLNKVFLEISGYEWNEVVGKSAFEIDAWINPSERKQVLKVLRKYGRIDKYPILLKDAYSRIRNVLLSTEIFDNNGEMCVLLMFNDVTEQIKTEKRLQQNNRELETFMYKSSHNLKGPVASIKGLIYLAEQKISDDQRKEYFSLMQQSARGLEITLEELMDIARLKQGIVKLEAVDLPAMLEDISSRLRFMTDWENITFKVTVKHTSPFFTDSRMLHSILQNLVENAVKYKDEAKKTAIKVNATIKKKVVEISVKDNGLGIPEEQQDRIFDMFYRAHQKVSGTGLGLYLVRNSLEKLGGTIVVKSKEGYGSTFTLTLPNIRPEGFR